MSLKNKEEVEDHTGALQGTIGLACFYLGHAFSIQPPLSRSPQTLVLDSLGSFKGPPGPTEWIAGVGEDPGNCFWNRGKTGARVGRSGPDHDALCDPHFGKH